MLLLLLMVAALLAVIVVVVVVVVLPFGQIGLAVPIERRHRPIGLIVVLFVVQRKR